MTVVARLEEGALHPEQELRALLERAKGDGAVVSFTGLVRAISKGGQIVDRLILEHHPTLTQQSLEDIANEATAKFDVSHVHVVHRRGDVLAGDPVVFAGAAALHRRSAFEAADYLMDRRKTEAVFWKLDVGPQGSNWIELTEADHADRERWS